MKSLLIAILVLSGGLAQAAQYDCKLSNGSASDPKPTVYSFDTVRENNKFVDLGQGTEVGCIVFRSTPQLVTCGIGNGEKFSIFVTSEEGSSVISFQTNSNGNKSELICVKKP